MKIIRKILQFLTYTLFIYLILPTISFVFISMISFITLDMPPFWAYLNLINPLNYMLMRFLLLVSITISTVLTVKYESIGRFIQLNK